MPIAEFQPLFQDTLAYLQKPHTPGQLLIIALGLLAGWLAQRLLAPRLWARADKWVNSARLVRRLVFPVAALIVVVLGRALLAESQPVHLLNVAVALLWAMVVIRAAVRLLRYVFGEAGWLSNFERLIAAAVWVAFALHVTGLLPDLLRLLDELDFYFGKHRVSVLLIGYAALSIGTALIAALGIGRFLENRVMGAAALDINLRVMLVKLLRPLLVLTALLIALPTVGIDLTALSVFGGALGVGLGFGLQKIAANYVSGFIILLDRSVKIGDLVTVDNRTGQVTQMTARYVVVAAPDGTEAIIPNETIIGSTVVNHSYTEPRVRIGIQTQVAYAADLEVAMRLMTEAAQNHPRVLADPPPLALIKSFGDNGINLELGVWVDDPEKGGAGLCSDLYLAIARAFRTHSIEIPFPQREVRLLGDPRRPPV